MRSEMDTASLLTFTLLFVSSTNGLSVIVDCPTSEGTLQFRKHSNTILGIALPYLTKTVQNPNSCTFLCSKDPNCSSFNKVEHTSGFFSCENFDKIATEDFGKLLQSNFSTHSRKVKKKCQMNIQTCQHVHDLGYRKTGRFELWDTNGNKTLVVCDLESTSEAWTLLQRRFNGSVYFYRNWASYKNGFGDLSGEFWLGLEKMYKLSQLKPMVIRFDLWDGNTHKYAEYHHFEMGDESTDYRVQVGEYTGNAGSSFLNANNKGFSTKDVRNDVCLSHITPCAKQYEGAWWYHCCMSINVNGHYYYGTSLGTTSMRGMSYKGFRGLKYSMQKTEVKFRHAFN